jgi:hypothetical protein
MASENNKFGMGLLQPSDNDIENVAKLVNSNGGKWGYVTLVIQENDKNTKKWQEIFDKLRKFRLIPIVRIATIPEGNNWKRPDEKQAKDWAIFLDSLNWVVKNRYVILFNEPNHATEWGGRVDSKSFKNAIKFYSQALKEKNRDFFVMMAGFDASAPNATPNFLDEYSYLSQIVDGDLFKYIDGWSSHSYPNPGFVGSVYDYGKGSVRTYQWELGILKELGIDKKLPIFITETGWPHKENTTGRYCGYYSCDTTSIYIVNAFNNVWLPDENVVAVTPFVFNYQGDPFDVFSWVKPDGKDFYPQYYEVQSVNKIEGNPNQINKILIKNKLPIEILEGSIYSFELDLRNEGQSILDRLDGYKLLSSNNNLKINFSNFSEFIPFTNTKIKLYLNTEKDEIGDKTTKISLYKKDKLIIDFFNWNYKVLALPKLEINVNKLFEINTKSNKFELQVFDKEENMVFSQKNIEISNGKGQIGKIRNVVLGEKYRVVILHSYYLPRQEYVVFKKDNNRVKFESMLPLDYNLDGNFSIEDVYLFFTKLL